METITPYFVIKEFMFRIIPNYAHNPNTDKTRPTYDELKKILSRTKKWNDVAFKKEVDEIVRIYDPQSIRVEIEGRHVANIPYVNSPLMSLLIDLAASNIIQLECRAQYNGVFEHNNQVDLWLHIRILTTDFDLVQVFQDFNFIEVDEYSNILVAEDANN